MANIKKTVPGSVPGEFFVDTTCINCDTCRQLAPDVFGDDGSYSFVKQQPAESETREALRALLACPTGSIGTIRDHHLRPVRDDFPLLIEDEVYYCGFVSPKSFGGSSYFIHHPEGNWLVDSPKFLPDLVGKFDSMGGLHTIFLTHSDDVADADRYAEKFGAKRIIHREELHAQPGAEIILEGEEDRLFGKDFRAIVTPGHTKGHCVLLYKDKFLFSGDHIWWSPRQERLLSTTTYCQYSWDAQMESVEKLLNYSFEWILPGHGRRAHLDPKSMREAIQSFLAQGPG